MPPYIHTKRNGKQCRKRWHNHTSLSTQSNIFHPTYPSTFSHVHLPTYVQNDGKQCRELVANCGTIIYLTLHTHIYPTLHIHLRFRMFTNLHMHRTQRQAVSRTVAQPSQTRHQQGRLDCAGERRTQTHSLFHTHTHTYSLSHYDALQYTALQYTTMQCTPIQYIEIEEILQPTSLVARCDTLQHIATHGNTHGNTRQHTATHGNTRQHAAR